MTKILGYIAKVLHSVEQWCRYRAEDIEFYIERTDEYYIERTDND